MKRKSPGSIMRVARTGVEAPEEVVQGGTPQRKDEPKKVETEETNLSLLVFPALMRPNINLL